MGMLARRQHTGNPYPTHGLGPICQWMNIHRGDRMEYLVSMSSRQAGLSAYAGQVFGASSEEAAQRDVYKRQSLLCEGSHATGRKCDLYTSKGSL